MNMQADERAALLAAPSISHILETSLYVDDLDRSKAFYQRVLAFDLIFQDERMCALRVPGSGVLLLFRKNGSLSPHSTPGGIIPPHGGTERSSVFWHTAGDAGQFDWAFCGARHRHRKPRKAILWWYEPVFPRPGWAFT